MKYIKTKDNFIRENKSYQLNEGQFSWMTHDTNDQIGSEALNNIHVYMYDNEGNKWKETRYDGYGNFGGMDYYDLVATMNGYDADRQKGIDLAFGKLKTKDKKRKTLFPALVTNPRYNWKRHDFTEEAESDPNQSWYQEEEDDRYGYDDYYESTVTEKEGVKHYTKDGKEWTGPTHKMPDGTLMTQNPHNEDSEKLFHKEDLKESVVTEGMSWNDVAKVMDAGLKKAKVPLSYARDYVKSLERMAKRNAKQFFKDYGDFTEDDFIEDVRYNMANEKVNEGRAAADRLLKDVVKGNASEVEGVKLSKEMADAFLMWLKQSTYGKKFGALPFDKLFTASFNWGLERYIGKDKKIKDEFKELKAKAKEMRKAEMKESLTESKGDKAVSMAQKKLDKVMVNLKANLLKFKDAKNDTDKETFKTEAGKLTQLRKDAQDNLEQAIQDAYADVELVVMENYDTEQRKEMASKGLALPDGSFPIKNLEDLKNAIQAYGRSKDQAAAAKFIAKRAKALGAEDLIPDTEDFQKALKEASFGRIPKFGK